MAPKQAPPPQPDDQGSPAQPPSASVTQALAALGALVQAEHHAPASEARPQNSPATAGPAHADRHDSDATKGPQASSLALSDATLSQTPPGAAVTGAEAAPAISTAESRPPQPTSCPVMTPQPQCTTQCASPPHSL